MSTYKLWQSRWIVIQTSCSKTIKIIYRHEDQSIKSNDIQLWVYTCKVSRTIVTKIKITMLSEAKWVINTIIMSISQTNIAMKYRRNSYLGILNQDKSINISMSRKNTISEHASNDIKNSHCAIKRIYNTKKQYGKSSDMQWWVYIWEEMRINMSKSELLCQAK